MGINNDELESTAHDTCFEIYINLIISINIVNSIKISELKEIFNKYATSNFFYYCGIFFPI